MFVITFIALKRSALTQSKPDVVVGWFSGDSPVGKSFSLTYMFRMHKAFGTFDDTILLIVTSSEH